MERKLEWLCILWACSDIGGIKTKQILDKDTI
jgi:hypothetical protein